MTTIDTINIPLFCKSLEWKLITNLVMLSKYQIDGPHTVNRDFDRGFETAIRQAIELVKTDLQHEASAWGHDGKMVG